MQSVEQYYSTKLNIRELLLLKGCPEINFQALSEELGLLFFVCDGSFFCDGHHEMKIHPDLAAQVIMQFPGGHWRELWNRLKVAKNDLEWIQPVINC